MALFCGAIKSNGEPCRQVVADEGELCIWHDNSRRNEAAAARRKGGRHSGGHNRRRSELTDGDLPPLTSHGAAEIWLDTIGRAVALGRVGNRDAQAAIRAALGFKDVRAAGKHAEQIAELERQVEELKSRRSLKVID